MSNRSQNLPEFSTKATMEARQVLAVFKREYYVHYDTSCTLKEEWEEAESYVQEHCIREAKEK